MAGQGGSNTGLLALDITGTGAGWYNWASSAIAPNLPADYNLIHMIGQAENAYNCGYMGFNYKGDGLTTNFLTFGLFNANNLLNITGAGYVGIGTTNPGAKLHIEGDGSSYLNVAGIIRSTGTTSGPSLRLESTGTNGKNYALYSGQASDPAGAGVFSIFDEGANADRLVIKNGYVGIGTTNPGVPLEVAGYTNIAISNYGYLNSGGAGNNAGSSSANFSIISEYDIRATQFIAISDKRTKTDISPITKSLETVMKLKPSNYTKIDKVAFGDKVNYGFIAQEVEEVLPEAVVTGKGEIPVLKSFEEVNFEAGAEYTILIKNGDDIKEQKYTTADTRPEGDIFVKSKTVNDFKSISYDMIFTVAVDAIQEQQKLIEDQQKEIDALRAQNAELAHKTEQLEQKSASIDVLKAEVENIKKAMTAGSYVVVNGE